MLCPFCLHKKSDVYNSRSTISGTIWRRRRCQQCHKAFTTEESFDPTNIWKVKKAKTTKPYLRAKLAMSILRACDHKTKRDAATWYLFKAVERLLLPIAAAGDQSITTDDIGTSISKVLKRFDPTAYIKYISYHQPTMDAATLRKQLKRS